MTRAKGRRVMPGQDATPRELREGQSEVVDKPVGFYNIQDGQKGRDGGPYLDHIERQQAEIARAYREDREPVDLNGTLPAAQGTFLVHANAVPDNSYSNPSMGAAPGLDLSVKDETFMGAKHLADPLAVLPVDTRTTAPAPDSGDPDRIVTSTNDETGVVEQTTVPNANESNLVRSNKTDENTKDK